MPNYVVRAIRSFLWSFLGTILASGILSSVAADGIVDWSLVSKVLVSAVAAGITGVISFVVNLLEDTRLSKPVTGAK